MRYHPLFPVQRFPWSKLVTHVSGACENNCHEVQLKALNLSFTHFYVYTSLIALILSLSLFRVLCLSTSKLLTKQQLVCSRLKAQNNEKQYLLSRIKPFKKILNFSKNSNSAILQTCFVDLKCHYSLFPRTSHNNLKSVFPQKNCPL